MLDRTRTDEAYVLGRLAAIVEMAHDMCKNEYGKVNMRLVSTQPISLTQQFVSVHKCWSRYPEAEKEFSAIVNLLPSKTFPEHIDTEKQSQLYVGYYHQKSAMEREMLFAETTVEHHTAGKVDVAAVKDNIVDDLHK